MPAEQNEFATAINNLSATTLRFGLAAAIHSLQRSSQSTKPGQKVLEHIAQAQLPGLEGCAAKDLSKKNLPTFGERLYGGDARDSSMRDLA